MSVQPHGLDTDKQVFCYEQEFYPLSNFSSFALYWGGLRFDTAEAAYHWEKFPGDVLVRDAIQSATSAHEAFKIAEHNKASRRPDWDQGLVQMQPRVTIMDRILRAKAGQHEYVQRKLLETGDREIIENSWRDPFWGWGPNRDGQNMLGKLWMRIRGEMRQWDEANARRSRARRRIDITGFAGLPAEVFSDIGDKWGDGPQGAR